MGTPCVFCEIAAGRSAAQYVHQDEEVVAFHDLNPQAPVHVLVIPRRHIPRIADAHPADAPVLGRLQIVATRIAREMGLEERGYRTVINCGADAGQTVFHVHLHLLGGRVMGWPPWPRS